MKYNQMKIHCVLVFIFGFINVVSAQNIDLQKIDKTDLQNYIRTLSSSGFKGRKSGTDGGEKAANFIGERFRELHLSAYENNSYFQPVPLIRKYIGESHVKTPQGMLYFFDQYVASNNTDIPEEIEKQVVFGGSGTPDELDKIDVSDKVVLVFYKSLRNTIPLNRELAKRKAFGLIVAMTEDNSRFDFHKKVSYYLLQQKILSADTGKLNFLKEFILNEEFNLDIIPEYAVSNAAVPSIMGLSVRELKSFVEKGNIAAVPERKIRMVHQKIHETFTSDNVIGTIEGKSRKSIVISAHYDHLGEKEGAYFPGADDNASGVAALLELADFFSGRTNLPYTLIFLAATAEESGMLGSEYFVKNPVAGLSDSILLNINIDMISRDDIQTKTKKKNLFYFMSQGVDDEIVNLFKTADSTVAGTDMIYQSDAMREYFDRSDQRSFYRKGIPTIFLSSGIHNDYHTVSDSYDKINYENLTQRVRLIAKAIDLIESEYSPPAGIKD